ncbi:phage tail protein [Thalassotalea sp. PLHSN55]|uniref:phage tail protein n=1 Tax=Thalassotalea sp. PLHSN55 TaxID=3435888 RepID=UPI003F8378A7
MSEPFVGEVRMWACSYAPRDWAFCDGSELQISQFTTLFAILGNTYGGDGRTTFALPNLTDRAPMHQGRGPGLTSRRLGELGGLPAVQLSSAENPAHSHSVYGTSEAGDTASPTSIAYMSRESGNRSERNAYLSTLQTTDTNLALETLATAGQSQAHENRQPFIGVNFCIALDGLFPARN